MRNVPSLPLRSEWGTAIGTSVPRRGRSEKSPPSFPERLRPLKMVGESKKLFSAYQVCRALALGLLPPMRWARRRRSSERLQIIDRRRDNGGGKHAERDHSAEGYIQSAGGDMPTNRSASTASISISPGNYRSMRTATWWKRGISRHRPGRFSRTSGTVWLRLERPSMTW